MTPAMANAIVGLMAGNTARSYKPTPNSDGSAVVAVLFVLSAATVYLRWLVVPL
jgi:hypothetical protein